MTNTADSVVKYESESLRFVDFRSSAVLRAAEWATINVTRNANEYSIVSFHKRARSLFKK